MRDKKDKSGKVSFVERHKITLGDPSPEQVAHEATNREYQDGAKRGHEENVAMHKERMLAKFGIITVPVNPKDVDNWVKDLSLLEAEIEYRLHGKDRALLVN